MATTITYKGSVIATATNTTKTLNTQGKYMEGNVIVTDVTIPDPDFVVRLDYNTQTNQWEPQCTFAEIQAANAAGKTIGVLVEDSAGNYMAQAYGQYVDLDDDEYFEYITDSYNSTGDGIIEEGYAFRSTGITFNRSTEYELPKTLGTKTITANGTYNAWNNDYINGYSEVTVNINPRLQTKTAQPSETQQIITPDSKAALVGTIECNITKNAGTSYVRTNYDLPLVKNKTYRVVSNSDAYVGTTTGSHYSFTIDCIVTYTVPDGTLLTVNGASTIIEKIEFIDFDDGNPYVQIKYKNSSYVWDAGSLTLTIYEDYDGLSQVTIAAVPSSYVGSDVARKSDSDLTASGSVVTVPSGYYSAQASKAVAAGAVAVPTTAITANPTVSVNTSGLVTASVAATSTVAPTITAGYVSTGASGAMNVSGSSTLQLTTQAAATITPSESQQTAVASQRYTTGNVVVAAISANYVGSGITRRSSTDLTASGSAVTAPAGYYSAAATKTVSAGTAGTPTAAKGTVSNHQISITPSVTNTTGWITGSTKTGTAATVSASELVSGTSTISANGIYNVTNYASAAVSIDYVTYYTGRDAPTSSLGSDGDIYLQV